MNDKQKIHDALVRAIMDMIHAENEAMFGAAKDDTGDIEFENNPQARITPMQRIEDAKNSNEFKRDAVRASEYLRRKALGFNGHLQIQIICERLMFEGLGPEAVN